MATLALRLPLRLVIFASNSAGARRIMYDCAEIEGRSCRFRWLRSLVPSFATHARSSASSCSRMDALTGAPLARISRRSTPSFA